MQRYLIRYRIYYRVIGCFLERITETLGSKLAAVFGAVRLIVSQVLLRGCESCDLTPPIGSLRATENAVMMSIVAELEVRTRQHGSVSFRNDEGRYSVWERHADIAAGKDLSI